MAQKLIEQIGVREFTPETLAQEFSIKKESAAELVQYGEGLGIFIEVIERPNVYQSEFMIKNSILLVIEYGKTNDEILELEKYLEKYAGEIQFCKYVLTEDMQELQRKIFQKFLLRKRNEATELIVGEIERTNYIFSTRDDFKSEMWIYSDGIYVPQGKTFIKEFCRKILGEAYTTQIVTDVTSKIEADTFIEQEKFFNGEISFEVPIRSGILNILTKEVYPFSPKKIFFNKLPIEYIPKKDCPKIKENFKKIMKDEDDVKLLFEIFGYLLLNENKFERAFMFVGKGRNGKTKFLELIKKFLGIDNCSALPLKAMVEDSFTIHELFGKRANLSGDLSFTDLKDTGILKMLIGRDFIQAKRKFLNDVKFTNSAKLFFACNELPKIYDMTDGFWTKWVLIEFPYQFMTQEQINELPKEEQTNKKIINTEIIKELTSPDELSGLLNQALEGLARILKNNNFSYSKSTKEIREAWIRQSDSFTSFCMDEIEENNDGRIGKKELRKEFNKYCKKFRLKGCSDKYIKIVLENMFGVVDVEGYYKDDRERMWLGISFKKNNEIVQHVKVPDIQKKIEVENAQ